MIYISMLSGGQDSTAMTIRLLELGEPLDYIVFSDTGLEHKEMYEYIDKLDAFFQRKYGIKITWLHPKNSFEHWVFGEIKHGENAGMIRGTPRVALPCYWRREAKEYSFDRWCKKEGIKEFTKYVGYTASETKRASGIEQFNCLAPLMDWGWGEAEVQKYLKENMMENKLYQHFSRTGCAVCPKQRLDDKFMVWKHYPDVWAYMSDIEKRLKEARSLKGEKHSPAWHDLLFIEDMEKLFIKKDRTPTFDFEFEEVQDCFCKI